MKRRDIEWAFGSADSAFENAVHRALQRLSREEARPVKKIKWGLIAAVAACLALSGIAYAAARGLGLLDYLRGRLDEPGRALPGAEAIVQEGLATERADGDWASFAVQEAVYDGQYVYLALRVTPFDQQTLLLPEGDLSVDMRELCPAFEGRMTAAEYVKAQGIRRVLGVDFRGLAPEGARPFFDCRMDADGVLTCYLYAPCADGEVSSPRLLCELTSIMPYVQTPSRVEIPLDLRASGIAKRAVSARGADYPACGLRVEKVTLTGTPMAAYVAVEYTVTDWEKYEECGADFVLLDESGRALATGMTRASETSPLAGGERRLFTTALAPLPELPAAVLLQAIDFGANSYGVQRIVLIKD